jgi:hypothetical protein
VVSEAPLSHRIWATVAGRLFARLDGTSIVPQPSTGRAIEAFADSEQKTKIKIGLDKLRALWIKKGVDKEAEI